MIEQYLQERYPEEDAFARTVGFFASGAKIQRFDFGFYTWKLVGDALMLPSIYVKPEFRGKPIRWTLFEDMKQRALKLGARILMGFSDSTERSAKERHVMKKVGFIPTMTLKDGTIILMRGTN